MDANETKVAQLEDELKRVKGARNDLQRRLDAARANQQTILAELARVKGERDELLTACKLALFAATSGKEEPDAGKPLTDFFRDDFRREVANTLRAAIARAEGGKDSKT